MGQPGTKRASRGPGADGSRKSEVAEQRREGERGGETAAIASASLPLRKTNRGRRTINLCRRDGRRNWFSSIQPTRFRIVVVRGASIRYSIRDADVDGGHKSSGERSFCCSLSFVSPNTHKSLSMLESVKLNTERLVDRRDFVVGNVPRGRASRQLSAI